jgi:hypothetical protein
VKKHLKYTSLKTGSSYRIIACGNGRLCELGLCGTKITLIRKLYNWIYVFHTRGALVAVRRTDLEHLLFIEEG